jgi:hypothetical protein
LYCPSLIKLNFPFEDEKKIFPEFKKQKNVDEIFFGTEEVFNNVSMAVGAFYKWKVDLTSKYN